MRTRALGTLALLLLVAGAAATLAASAAVAAASTPPAAPAGPAPGYLRYPDIHGDQVVFAAESDLWIASDRGGPARRLTSHPGAEYFPSFSPDGRLIAFTGEYDGNRDVYVITAAGGEPKRLTWHPDSDEVVGWTPDGASVIFRSRRELPVGRSELYTVPAAGGEEKKLPLGWAARIDMDPDSGLWAFNRISNEGRTWKRYRGGTVQDIWVGDPRKADFKRVSTENVTDGFPMWHGGRIWFLSDKGGTMNVWSMKPDGTDRKRHTDLSPWDARWPGMGPDGRIVFMLAGDIHLFDPRDGSERKIPIDLPSDRILTRERFPDAVEYMTSLDLSPDGKRLAVVTRGEIFSVPVKEGVTLAVTAGSGAHEIGASYDPKGEKLVYVTDPTGEQEIAVRDAWGRGPAKTVRPAGASGWLYPPRWSPDGKWLAWSDQTQTLYVMPADGGKPIAVDRSPKSEIREYVWSPDGRWLAYSKLRTTDYSSIYIYDTKDAKITEVTGAFTSDSSPAWDPDGRYLFFLSDRTTNPVLDTRDWNNVEVRTSKPYLALLRPDVPNPLAKLEGLPPKPGEEADKAKSKDKDAKADKAKGKEKDAKAGEEIKPVEIELSGLADRIAALPVPPGRYGSLSATAGRVFWVLYPIKGMAEAPGLFSEPKPENTLMSFDLEKKKAEPFVDGMTDYQLQPKAGKVVVLKGPGEIYVADAGSPPSSLDEGKVSLDGIVIELDPRAEWAQMYHEAWRLMRDFYWDPGMAGIDWQAVRDQYATLLPRLSGRGDLNDLLGELIGEMDTSHTYIWGGGDFGRGVPHVSVGLLGADLAREGDAYRVVRIYRGDPADNVVSPLLAPGVGVKEGEYIVAVDHRPFPKDAPWYAALSDRAGKTTLLSVNSKPTLEGAREVAVTPIPDDHKLRYADWVRQNREYVAAKTGGKIGYIHIPDMWTDGLVAFNTWFYPQLDKEGMVVDARWNGGGAVSGMLVERLGRKIISFDRARGGGISTYPQRTLNGPFVVLTNEFAGSDGDIFPMAIQLEKLAPVIGMRSWGGVVGLDNPKPLADGGSISTPQYAWWDPQQGWGLENRGVIPDIEVQNMPQELARGVDAQLDRAIAEVMKLHEQHPPVVPKFGPAPDKSRGAYSRTEK